MAWPGLVVVPEHVVTRQAWGFHSFNNLLGAACCSGGDVTQIYTPTGGMFTSTQSLFCYINEFD